MQGKKLIVRDGVSISYRVLKKTLNEGQLVFNNGLVCSDIHWTPHIERWKREKKNLLFHDYRGHYKSGGALDTVTFENIAKDLKEILDHENITSCWMLGHSMGVNVTLEFARRYPELLRGIVLVSGTVFGPLEFMFGMNVEFLTPIFQGAMKKFPNLYKNFWRTLHQNPLVLELLHGGGFHKVNVTRDYVKSYAEGIGQLAPELFYYLLEKMGGHDCMGALETIKVPALVVSGVRDKLIPLNTQNILVERLQNSEYYLVEDAGHVPLADYPTQCFDRMNVFFKDT